MAGKKRELAAATVAQASRTSKRQKKEVDATASSSRPSGTALPAVAAPQLTQESKMTASADDSRGVSKPRKAKIASKRSSSPRSSRSSVKEAPTTARPRRAIKGTSASAKCTPEKTTMATTKTTRGRKKSVMTQIAEDDTTTKAKVSVDVAKNQAHIYGSQAEHDRELEDSIEADGPSYWLMKAEPESRITDKGKDVKFSIDDLRAATSPEAWDGVRNAVARNNIRLMMKGDMAFFYHSNCKVPGIVGTMEIVQEHSVDSTAFDKDHPYYDENSNPEKPKWHVVHVEFRQKFPQIIKLKELQKYAREGGVLENLQTLKQTRLSVSKVTKKEWDFTMDLLDVDDVAAAAAHHQPNMLG